MLLGVRVAVDAHDLPRRADAVGDQARVAAGAEGAVDHHGAGRGVERGDQLTREDRDVGACHVENKCHGCGPGIGQAFPLLESRLASSGASSLSRGAYSAQRARSQTSIESRLPITRDLLAEAGVFHERAAAG